MVKKKVKKCQPAARDAPDLIQTECIPDRGLARPQKKSTERKNYKMIKKRKKPQKYIKEVRTELKWKLLLLLIIGRILLVNFSMFSRDCNQKLDTQNEIEAIKYTKWLVNTWILVGWTVRNWRSKHKVANKLQRIKNGNRNTGIKIIHWNLGAKRWENKRDEIELLLAEMKPELCYITEANLHKGLEDHETNIPDHYLVYPNTMNKLGYARIMLIVKNGVTVQKLDKLMSNNVSTIWVKLGTGKKTGIKVGGVYREFQYLGDHRDLTRQDIVKEQELRWNTIVHQWTQASSNSSTIVIGDLNIDFDKWETPDQNVEKLVEIVQEKIESKGFRQLVKSYTRSMNDQVDSIIDHIWVNCELKVISHFNRIRSCSDHNVVGVIVSRKDIKVGGQNLQSEENGWILTRIDIWRKLSRWTGHSCIVRRIQNWLILCLRIS